MRLKRQLLTVANAYCGPRGRSRTRVSLILFGDSRRLRQLGEGADMASGRVEDALQWFSDHWPDDVEWPVEVSRPAKGTVLEP